MLHRRLEPLAEELATLGPADLGSGLSALFAAAEEVLWYLDLRRRSLTFSRGLEVAFGHRPDVMNDPLLAAQALVHPDDRDRVVSQATEAIRSGAPTWSGELRLARADGTYVQVRARAVVVRDAAGRPTAVAGSISDLSGAAGAEAELRERGEQLVSLAQSARRETERSDILERIFGGAIWELDVESGTVRRSRRSRSLLGQEGSETRSRDRLWDHVHPDDRAALLGGFERWLGSTEDEWSATYRMRQPDGGHVRVRDRAIAIRDARGRALRAVGSTTRVAPAADRREPAPRVYVTERQAEVLELLRAGHSNKQIAVHLGIGEQSVKDHVSNLYQRFGVPNRAALVAVTDRLRVEPERRSRERRGSGRDRRPPG